MLMTERPGFSADFKEMKGVYMHEVNSLVG